MYCTVLHCTALCNVGGPGERRGRARRRSAPRLSSPSPDSGVHILTERERSQDHNNQDDGRNIPEMCDAEEVGAGLCPGRQGVKSCVVN